MRLKWTVAAALALTLGAASGACAQDKAPADVVRARIDRFREMGTAFKTINDELKKPQPLKIMLTISGSRIASAAREIQPMFPPGAGPAPGIKTKARPEIWARRKDFDAKFTKLLAEADKMNIATKSGDFNAMRAQAKVLGGACQDCHKAFRDE